jgi:ClpA/ClpB-like protein
MDSERLRLDPDLQQIMRAAAAAAVAHGAQFVAPPHLLLGLLADPRVAPAIGPLVAGARIREAAAEPAKKPPEIVEHPDSMEGAEPPFVRYDTLAFRSTDGDRPVYLDAEAFHIFIEGARRAEGVYRAKHLVFGFTAEAVKDRDLLELFGADPQGVAKAVDEL